MIAAGIDIGSLSSEAIVFEPLVIYAEPQIVGSLGAALLALNGL